ncbi:MAG TPA: metallophosphoesterase family protein [Planctomycetota bacterium]|nr:metallophosphoesterase family protein [Planctomycetota bacterium]
MAVGNGSHANGNGASRPRLRAIISDIHGNLEALLAVLEDIRSQNVDEIVCLGDVVGYGPNPVECLKIIRHISHWSLCGNHDMAMFMAHAVGFNEGAAKAVAWQREIMQPRFFSLPGKVARWRWLENLPAMRTEGNVMYVHASPRDPIMEYVLEKDFQDIGFGPSQKAVEMFEKFEWLCFVGHSHRPGVATHDYKWIKPAELDNMTYVLPKDKKTLVNIGAVGQPRDKINTSCYVLFDGEKVRYRRVPYDIEAVVKKIEAIPALEKRFAERLRDGT